MRPCTVCGEVLTTDPGPEVGDSIELDPSYAENGWVEQVAVEQVAE